jgi:hypothetical protein
VGALIAKRHSAREPESRKTGFPLSRERRKGDFPDKGSSHSEESPGRESREIYAVERNNGKFPHMSLAFTT